MRNKRIRLEREEVQRRHREWLSMREEKLRLFREEEDRLAKLLAEVDAWHRSQELRASVADVIRRVEEEHGPQEPGGGFGQWVDWATSHAGRLDPLIEGPPSILDEKAKWDYARSR